MKRLVFTVQNECRAVFLHSYTNRFCQQFCHSKEREHHIDVSALDKERESAIPMLGTLFLNWFPVFRRKMMLKSNCLF